MPPVVDVTLVVRASLLVSDRPAFPTVEDLITFERGREFTDSRLQILSVQFVASTPEDRLGISQIARPIRDDLHQHEILSRHNRDGPPRDSHPSGAAYGLQLERQERKYDVNPDP